VHTPSSSSTPAAPAYDPGDVLKTEYRFNRTEKDDIEAKDSWEKQLAKTYDEGLFKEFALADLSQYKRGKVRHITAHVQSLDIFPFTG